MGLEINQLVGGPVWLVRSRSLILGAPETTETLQTDEFRLMFYLGDSGSGMEESSVGTSIYEAARAHQVLYF